MQSKKKEVDTSPISRIWCSEILTNQIFLLFFSIIKLLPWIFDGTFRNNSFFFFYGILISKQIAIASLFSFSLRIKTKFHKNITDDPSFFFGIGMYRKHPNHTYGRNRNKSASNLATMCGQKLVQLVTSEYIIFSVSALNSYF